MTKLAAVSSEFKLVRFSILESHFKVVITDNKTPSELPELPLEFEFETFLIEPNFLRMVVGVFANKDGTIPGYSFSVIADGVFSLPAGIDEKKRANYTSFSALPMMVNSIRAYLMNISAYSFYGQYTLPLVDVKDLLNKKIEEVKSREAGKNSNEAPK